MPRPGRETRNRIVRRAADLFCQRAFGSIGLQEIIARCGTSKGVFYHYFRSKEELAEAVLDLHCILMPSMMQLFFVGKTWAEGVDAWVRTVVGTEEQPLFGATAMANVGIPLLEISPVLAHKSMWGLKTFERAVTDELERRGFAHEDASRRSATSSALVEGHALRLAMTRDPRCASDLKRDLLPLASDPKIPWVAFPGAVPLVASAVGLVGRPEKKVKNPIDIVDGRSIIVAPERGKSPANAEAKRQKIVARLADIFWRKGYHSTSLSDISGKFSIPKGSLHTYFRDKRQMALAVFDYYGRVGNALLDSAFEGGSWHRAVAVLMGAMKFGGLTRYMFGSPVTNMGTEFINIDDELAARAAELLKNTERRFARALEGIGGDRARSMAGTAVALCHGHLTRMLLYSDLGNAEECGEDLLALFIR